MTHRTALELGRLAGCLAGIWGYGARAARPVLPEITYTAPPPCVLDPLPSVEDRPRYRLVTGDHAGIRDPLGDHNTVWLVDADFRGADLREVDLRQAGIRRCDFRGANIEHADLTDAAFDTATRWPEGFDPREHGAIPE